MPEINTFANRRSLTEIIESRLAGLFESEDVELLPFGVETIGRDNPTLKEYIASPESNASHAGMLVKFAPDFILIHKSNPKKLYFIEVKATVTPLWSTYNLGQIRASHPDRDIRLKNVGLIAREAWNAYSTLYPDTSLVVGCTYNPKLLMAQFVRDTNCLRCYGSGGTRFDCE